MQQHSQFDKQTQQVIALAAMQQCAALVHQLTTGQPTEETDMLVVLKPLYTLKQAPVQQLYSPPLLGLGISTLGDLLNRKVHKHDRATLRYFFSFVQLANYLLKDEKTSNRIAEHISQYQYQLQHYPVTHDNIIANLNDLYLKTISPLPKKIMLTGKQSYLSQQATLQKIRAVLLAGIRAAFLWQQLGGRTWQMMLMRRKMLTIIKNLQSNVLLTEASPS